jgi:hypothetical protein
MVSSGLPDCRLVPETLDLYGMPINVTDERFQDMKDWMCLFPVKLIPDAMDNRHHH